MLTFPIIGNVRQASACRTAPSAPDSQIDKLKLVGHYRPYKVYLPAIALALLLLWSSVGTGRAGLSRLMSEYGSATSSLGAGERAIELDSSDAEAHHIYGQLSADNGDLDRALMHFERATKLRPNDYFLWYELGRLQDEKGDLENAIGSLRKATDLAPHYSQPRWLLGNVLLRHEDIEAAFVELRVATKSDPTLFPQLLELAWGVYESKIDQVLQTLQPSTNSEQVTIARFLFNHDNIPQGLQLLSAVQQLADEDRGAVVTELIGLQEYQAARDFSASSCVDNGLCNSSFEDAILTTEAGFGWQTTKLVQTVKVLADTAQPAEGRRSLRVEYSGNFDESTPVVSQLAPVSEGHYRLTWKSRTEALASAGMPVIAIFDVGDGRELGRSQPLAKGNAGWIEYSVEFATPSTTKAVKISVQRDACNVKPCPITGRAWFDQFSLATSATQR